MLDMTQIKAVLQDDTKAANKGIDGCIRKTLIAFYERAENDLKKFQEQVETFYNDAMDRASGTYKRSTRKVILVISLVLATALNADTVHIAKTLWENPSALKKTADNIQSAVKNIHKDQNGNFVIDSVSSNGDQLQIEMMRTDTTNAPDTVRGVTRLIKHEGGKAVPVQTDTVKEIKKIREVMKTQVVYLQHSGIPLGWTKDNMPSGSCKGKAIAWAYKIFGLLLTACALLLGAPFWFDLINKFINVRGTGKKPEEAEDNGDAKNIKTKQS